MAKSNTRFVLVHGAWHRAWHFHILKSRLEEAGYTVSTLDLPSIGPDVSKLPLAGALRADVEAIKAVLEQAASESEIVIPVLHSDAGAPGGEAAAELSDAAKRKVQRLVYLCAFVIERGTAVHTYSGGQVAPWAMNKDGIVTVPDPIPVFYSDADTKLAKEAARRVMPMSYSGFTDLTQHSPWLDLPCTYVFTTQDNAIFHEWQQAWLANIREKEGGDWQTFTLEGGHSPFLVKPDECVRLLEIIVEGYA